MDEYLKQAKDFLEKTNTKVNIRFKKFGKHFFDDKEARNIYRVTIRRDKRSFSLNFGDSIKNSMEGTTPNEYDILACLTKHDVGSFENFCDEYGYDYGSRRAEKTYHAVCDEYDNVCKIWSDGEIEMLQEIN
jgi:hypothetical protein